MVEEPRAALGCDSMCSSCVQEAVQCARMGTSAWLSSSQDAAQLTHALVVPDMCGIHLKRQVSQSHTFASNLLDLPHGVILYIAMLM